MMLLALIAAACLSVSGPNITAGDLAKAVPAFTPSDGGARVGYAPAPGVQRVMHPAEISNLLTRLDFKGEMPANDVCFARPAAPVSTQLVLQAMQKTLGGEAHIEVLEVSKFPAPEGELIFPRENLGAPPIALWRGYVRFDEDKKYPVWARVKISVQTSRIVALEELKPGIPIRASQVALQRVEEFPQRRVTPSSLKEIEGYVPRRFISANTPIWSDSVEPPNDITRGDQVVVIVNSGLAVLSFDAEAQASGHRGDVVSFKNPESGKLFRARIEGPDRAGVITPSIKP